MSELRDYEEEARRIRTFEPALISGLLQTEDYARAVISVGGVLDAATVDQRVAERMERQERLSAVSIFVVQDEAALWRVVGGHRVHQAQLARLVELAERPNVHIHVIPAEAGVYPGLGGGFMLITLPDNEQVAYLDTTVFGQVVDRADLVNATVEKWDSLLGEALPERATLDLIRKLQVTS